ncbi:MAG: DUF817 family protein [Tabrizicola sp.]
MEWFKVHAGSRVTRATRVFVMAFAPCPRFPPTVLLAAAIHVSFFAHRFLPDIRLALIVATIVLGWRTRIRFRIHDRHGWMPLTVAALLSALALWVAENPGTATGTWTRHGQIRGEMVSFAKLGSWHLPIHVAFVAVTLMTRRAPNDRALDLRRTSGKPAEWQMPAGGCRRGCKTPAPPGPDRSLEVTPPGEEAEDGHGQHQHPEADRPDHAREQVAPAAHRVDRDQMLQADIIGLGHLAHVDLPQKLGVLRLLGRRGQQPARIAHLARQQAAGPLHLGGESLASQSQPLFQKLSHPIRHLLDRHRTHLATLHRPRRT